MSIIDEIKIEQYQIMWLDDSYPIEPFYRQFGILETIEQASALEEGLETKDSDWISLDEEVFYWLSAYNGETIERFTKKARESYFYYVKEKGERNE